MYRCVARVSVLKELQAKRMWEDTSDVYTDRFGDNNLLE